MPKVAPMQESFNAGELSPLMYARVSINKYKAGMEKLENYVPFVQGPIERRPGSIFTKEIKDSTSLTRLLPFEFSTTQAYVIEFGDQYMRFYKDHGLILEANQSITDITAANPAVITIASHGYSNGDEVYITGTGVSAIDNKYHIVSNVATNTFEIPVDGTGWSSGGTAAKVYELATPYAAADLFQVKYAQSADVIYLTHPNYAPRELSRTGHTSWTITEMVFEDGPYLNINGSDTYLLSTATTGTPTVRAVSATQNVSNIISASHESAQNITNVVGAGPTTITISAHGYSNGETVWITGTGTALDDQYWIISNVFTNDFDVSGDGTGWSSGGTAERASTTTAEVTVTAHGYSEGDYVLFDSLSSVPDLDDQFLQISNVTTNTFDVAGDGTTYTSGGTVRQGLTEGINNDEGFKSTDVGRMMRILNASNDWAWGIITTYNNPSSVVIETKSTETFPTTATRSWRLGVWSDTDGYPSAVTFFEDRLAFAAPDGYPQRIDLSNTGAYTIFSPTEPDGTVIDSNAISFTLNASNVNRIRWILDTDRGLAAGTVGGEWLISPSTTNVALTPSNVNAKRMTAHGSADIMPERIDKSILFVQRAKRKIRELNYSFEVDGLKSPDTTILADHISKTGIVELAYQQEPYSLLWAVRADGELCCMTHNTEQEVKAWHRHIVGGYSDSAQTINSKVESIVSIPSPSGDKDDLWMIVNRYINGGTKRYVEYLSDFWTEETDPDDAIYSDSALTYSGAATDTISGLDHLEGESVAILADGAFHSNKTVASGAITLDREVLTAQIGLNFISYGKTLRPDAGAADGTAQGKIKRIHESVFRVQDLGGLEFSADGENWDIHTARETDDLMDTAVPLYTGDIPVEWDGSYELDAFIHFRQQQPFPGRILAIMPRLVTQDE